MWEKIFVAYITEVNKWNIKLPQINKKTNKSMARWAKGIHKEFTI